MYGGYGRGEGAWIVDESASFGCRPYNDYDILVIGGKQVPSENIADLKTRLAQEFGLRWIDLSQRPRWQLRLLPKRIHTYELREASKVVSGRKDILLSIRRCDPRTLSLREAETLFFTRLWTLTGGVSEEWLEQGLSGEDARFFRNQMAKCVLAAGDMILLENGDYHWSYRERYARLRRGDYSLSNEKVRMLACALREKLRPQDPPMSADEVQMMYSKARRFFLDSAMTVLGTLYRRELTSISDARAAFYTNGWSYVKRAARQIRLRSRRYDRYLSVVWAQAHLVAYKDSEWRRPDDLEAAASLVKSAGGRIEGVPRWEVLRHTSAQMRLLVT